MKSSHSSPEPELLRLANPQEVLRAGLARMESIMDRCLEVGADALPGGSAIEQKVRVLILDPQEGVSEEVSVRWLGHAVLDTKALYDFMATHPESAGQEITVYLNKWVAESAPAWAGMNTAERLHRLIALFCAALEGYCEGYLSDT